jgi:hypothetical protein
MDANVFRSRIAPLLSASDLRALRLADRRWQWVVDQLLPVKGAFFGLRRKDRLTTADARYAHAVKLPMDNLVALLACAGGELADLQWALATFRRGIHPSWQSRLAARVTRTEWMELLMRDHSVKPTDAFLGCCEGGNLAMAQWLNSKERASLNTGSYGLRLACANGHLAVAQWLTQEFKLTADDARRVNNDALLSSCAYGHLAVADWLTQTFRLTITDARTADNYAFRTACQNGHVAVAAWLVRTFQLTAVDVRAADSFALSKAVENGHMDVVVWLKLTFNLALVDLADFL